MKKPIRIQRKRTAGFKMPENTVYVGRPSKWGNPFKVETLGNHRGTYVITQGTYINKPIEFRYKTYTTKYAAQKAAVEMYEIWLANTLCLEETELCGKNLACWCKIGEPCHADILLKLANK